MIYQYVFAVILIFSLLAGWLGVQALARAFAARHPEFGEPRDEGGGCGLFCRCRNTEACPRAALKRSPPNESA